MAPSQRMLFKITVLGDGGVGKTALTVQFTMSSFVETYDPTIEDCYRKQWVVDDQPCLLEVLDTAGQEEYTALRDQWIRDGEGFLIVYSITNRATFERIERIIERVHRVKDVDMPHSPYSPSFSPYGGSSPTSPTGRYPQGFSPGGASGASAGPSRIPITMVGNKRDQVALREVSTEEARQMAGHLECEFFEASAKTNTNVEACFKSLVRQIRAGKKGEEGVEVGGERRRKKRKCMIL